MPPTYSELADLIARLTEASVDGVDGEDPQVDFARRVPINESPLWTEAMAARESLIKNGLIQREVRR